MSKRLWNVNDGDGVLTGSMRPKKMSISSLAGHLTVVEKRNAVSKGRGIERYVCVAS